MHTSLNDLCVVEDHQCPFREIIGEIEEHVLSHLAMSVYQQF
jgi:hypothetical protein